MMVAGTSGLVITLAFWALVFTGFIQADRRGRGDLVSMINLAVVAWASARAAWFAAHGYWGGAAIEILIAFIYFRTWSRRRGDRHRAAKLIGGKARAIRDKLLRRQREAAQPGRPVTERI